MVRNNSRILFCSFWFKVPILFDSLSMDIDLKWSHAADDTLPVDVIVIRNGQLIMVDVIGTTKTVLSNLFIMSGETIIQGLTFFISLPIVGFRLAQ